MDDIKKGMTIIIDESSIRELFEGKTSNKQLVEVLAKIKKIPDSKCEIFTTPACVLHAIYSANSLDMRVIQDFLSVVTVVQPVQYGFKSIDFRNKEKITQEVIEFAKLISPSEEKIAEAKKNMEEFKAKEPEKFKTLCEKMGIDPDKVGKWNATTQNAIMNGNIREKPSSTVPVLNAGIK